MMVREWRPTRTPSGDVIHAFNERRLAVLGPQWTRGRPRLTGDDDMKFIVTTVTTRPGSLGGRFPRLSMRKFLACLARCHERRVVLGRERLRLILREAGVSFQRLCIGRAPPQMITGSVRSRTQGAYDASRAGPPASTISEESQSH
jgi:hypothetical protein